VTGPLTCSFNFRSLQNLRATAIEYLQQNFATEYTILYFFCDHRDPSKQSLQDLLHVAVKQLLDTNDSCFTAANAWREERHPTSKNRSKPIVQPLTTSEYIELVQRLCRCWKKVCLVVDAVDECSELTTFVNGLESLRKDSNIKLLLTSRHDIELIRAISPISGYKIAVTEHMQEDIQTYLASEVQSRIAHGSLKFKQKDLDLLIVDALKKNADGM